MADAFQPVFVDLVRNFTTTTGTDDFLLGPAANGYAGFGDALKIGDAFYYSAIGIDNPGETEVGRGTLMDGGIVSRDPVSGTKTSFTSGSTAVSLIAAAEWFKAAQAVADVHPVPVIDADFRNGLYLHNGAPAAFSDLFEEPQGLGSIVPGLGYTVSKDGGAEGWILVNKALFDEIHPQSGFTVVADLSVDSPNTENGRNLRAAVYADDTAFNQAWTVGAYWDPPIEERGGPYIEADFADADFATGPLRFIPLGGGTNRCAATFGAEGIHLAVEGLFVGSSSAMPGENINELYLSLAIEGTAGHSGVATSTIERVKIYRPIARDRLADLSARPMWRTDVEQTVASSLAPSTLADRIALARQLGTGVVLAQSAVPVSHSGDLVEAPLASVIVPANAMGPNGQLVVEALFSATDSAGSKICRVELGTFAITNRLLTTGGGLQVHTRIANRGTALSQVHQENALVGYGTTAATVRAIDTTKDQVLAITGTLGTVSDTVTLESYQITLFPKG